VSPLKFPPSAYHSAVRGESGSSWDLTPIIFSVGTKPGGSFVRTSVEPGNLSTNGAIKWGAQRGELAGAGAALLARAAKSEVQLSL
jgi:hypothetical protein